MAVQLVGPEKKGRKIMGAAGLPIATMELSMVVDKLLIVSYSGKVRGYPCYYVVRDHLETNVTNSFHW